MNITLKQHEITKAIAQYTERQGISLTNKTLEVIYTSGRGANGVSAELVIEDISIPGDEGPDTSGATETKVMGQTLAAAEVKPLTTLSEAGKADVAAADPADPVAEVAVHEPATLAEIIDAGINIAAVTSPEAETVAAVAVEQAPVAVEVVVEAKPTTSLFANNAG